MKDISAQAFSQNFEAYGILCFPKYPLTIPRVRESYNESELIPLHIEQIGTRYVAELKGTVKPEAIRLGASIRESMQGSALDDLDASSIGNIAPERIGYSGTFIVRDDRVRKAVIKRAKGRCEFCGTHGFKKSGGAFYVEAHHIINLAKQGPDTLDNVIALCANHHREAHYGEDRLELEAQFIANLAAKRSRK